MQYFFDFFVQNNGIMKARLIMEVSYFKVFMKCFIIFIVAISFNTKTTKTVEENSYIGLKYEEVEFVNGEITYKKPEFNSQYLNDYISDYIEKNSCSSLEYNIHKLDKNSLSLFLNCGNPESIIYDYNEGQTKNFDTLLKDSSEFINSVTRLLNLKYPKFVTNEVDILNGAYQILDNQLIGYYNTTNFGVVDIKINNNEIRELMNYNMNYDDAYQNEIYTLDANKKTIAFTFDDGPSYYDLETIDFLVDSHASATFFLVGNRINNYKDSVKKMVETDMEVGNHSYNHSVMTKLSNSQIAEQITKTNEIYNNLTGKNMTLFRPPYGAINSRVLLSTQMSSVLWSVDTLDWQSRNADKVYEKIIENVKDGDIVLMHSLYNSTLQAVKKVIPELYKQGYQIVSVSKLAELKGKTVEIGKNYTSMR